MQEELRYNRLLPYAEHLDSEANEYLKKIKRNLGRAAALREVRPGMVYWSSELIRYIRLYGRRFSKEDHVLFVKFFYQLITTPDLEPQLIENWGWVLLNLLKKKKLLSRSDLVLPWRPLYQTVQECMFGKNKKVHLKYIPRRVEEKLIEVIKATRIYFPASSTAEMLEEWRPYLCPFDMSMLEKVSLLCAFLPTQVMPDEHDTTFKLWFDEFMGLWDDCQNNVQWEGNWMSLFSRLARNTIGYIDWTPHIPKIFTRILRSSGIPANGNDQRRRSQPVKGRPYYRMKDVVTIIVALLGGGSTAQQHLTMLLTALEPFYHPSYSGSWGGKLHEFLRLLPAAFVGRLHNERHRKRSWIPQVPQQFHLTDDDVTSFVKSMEYVVSMAMSNKALSVTAAATVKNLALLKPDLVIPQLIDRMYMAFDTLTEPHQLSSMLHSLAFVCRVMLDREKFPDGANHAIPLLKLVLPGIDPNDFFKSVSVFTFISTFSSLIPLVDCSSTPQSRHDLTEADKELCFATAQFEEFIVLLMDRCFELVENSSLEQAAPTDRQTETRQSSEQMMGGGLGSTLQSVFFQCSPELFEVALKRLVKFATSNVFETEVAGRLCSQMCRSAAKAYPDLTLKSFIPQCYARIQTLTSDPETWDAERADKELLWYLQLTTEVVRCPGSALLAYESELTGIIDWCVHLRCKEASKQVAQLLQSILQFLLGVYPMEWRSLPIEFSLSVEEHLYIQDWGAVCDRDNVEMKWNTPLDSHIAFAQRLLSQFVIPEIEKVKQCTVADPNHSMEKEKLHQSLRLIHFALSGAAPILRHINGPVASGLPESGVSHDKMAIVYSTMMPSDVILDERLSRESLAKLMHSLLEHMWQEREHDTKALLLIAEIYFTLLSYYGVTRKDLEFGWKSFNTVQKVMEDRLKGRKKQLRPMLIERLQLQHERRVMEAQMNAITDVHFLILKDLLALSTSAYTEVRFKCQGLLNDAMFAFRYSNHLLLPLLLDNLQHNDSISHEQFKGSLYILQSEKCLYLSHCYWDTLSRIWPAIVQADHSEKPSISTLMSNLVKRIMEKFNSPAIRWIVPTAVVDMGVTIAFGTGVSLTETELSAGAEHLEETNETTDEIYENLVAQLVSLAENEKLHWRFTEFAVKFLVHLIRHDRLLPTAAVRFFIHSLNHETLAVRKMAITAVMAILKQQKRHHVTISINPYQLAGIADGSNVAKVTPGDRPDNMWHRYDVESLPRTEEQWNSTVFIDKTFWGFYCWPREMTAYAPYDQQPSVERTRNQLTERETVIYDAFSSTAFVEKLIGFLSMEERKGKDKYNWTRAVMFKGLFRNFGDSFLDTFKPHLQRLCADKQESSQRCAAEIIAGLVRSSKHWPFQKVKAMWEFLLPCLASAFNEISAETLSDWGTCLSDCSADRDPRRLHWLFEMIVSPESLNQSRGSFRDTSILYLLQRAVSQQEWRVPLLHHRLLEHLEPQLSHPYKLVRDRLGSVLSIVFLFDIELRGGRLSSQPTVTDFIERLLTGLQPLWSSKSNAKDDITEADGPASLVDMSTLAFTLPAAAGSPEDGQRQENAVVQLLKTALNWLVIDGSLQPLPPSLCRLLPLILRHSDQEEDEELDTLSKAALQQMAISWLPSVSVEPLLQELETVVDGQSWRAIRSALSFLSAIVFQNLMTLQYPDISSRIEKMLLLSLVNTQLEVREAAALCLSRLLQCGYFPLSSELTEHFTQMAAVKLPQTQTKGKAAESRSSNNKALVRRHGGVLGLAACVQAFPHTIPDAVPDILVVLSKHAHDPPVILSTVKKTVADFKHTHRDTWELHKSIFTDEQLLILADLLISPNYFT